MPTRRSRKRLEELEESLMERDTTAWRNASNPSKQAVSVLSTTISLDSVQILHLTTD